jgi:transcriptional regulator with XRE-family HTH domain
MKTLAARIRWARKKLGYSASHVDSVAGLCKGHTAMIESGARKNPAYKTVQALSVALEVEAAWLINGGVVPK